MQERKSYMNQTRDIIHAAQAYEIKKQLKPNGQIFKGKWNPIVFKGVDNSSVQKELGISSMQNSPKGSKIIKGQEVIRYPQLQLTVTS